MVENLSYSIVSKMKLSERKELLFHLLGAYIKKRHSLYKKHGYSNILLQTLSDNYSHKRKGIKGIQKVSNQLEAACFSKAASNENFKNMTYILPDKGGKLLFDSILAQYKIRFKFSRSKQGKIPDVLFMINDEIYILEHKSIKECGGGQDKQVSEILDFIKYTETNKNIHYITYMDGIFVNKFIPTAQAKNREQYKQAASVLKENPANYFVNTHTFEELIKFLIK